MSSIDNGTNFLKEEKNEIDKVTLQNTVMLCSAVFDELLIFIKPCDFSHVYLRFVSAIHKTVQVWNRCSVYSNKQSGEKNCFVMTYCQSVPTVLVRAQIVAALWSDVKNKKGHKINLISAFIINYVVLWQLHVQHKYNKTCGLSILPNS